MTSMKNTYEESLHSSVHLAKKNIHPKLSTMLEMGGMGTVFARGQGAYLYNLEGERYLDLLSGGGIHFAGRNVPRVNEALRDIVSDDLANICTVNASVLGGLVGERLKGLIGWSKAKVFFANSGSEATDVALRFVRYATRRRRFLYLKHAFHGRTWGAISVNGWASMKEGMDPLVPTATQIPANDLGVLRRELSRGDVAGFIFEPVQGMSLVDLDPGYLREAERLCKQFGTYMIADEIQTGLGRCGAWFLSREWGINPDIITISKTLSGGQVPVSCCVVNNALYERVFDTFKGAVFYYSTFAENNLAMAASLATLDHLEELDAPRRARELSRLFRDRLAELSDKHDVIDRIAGKGLMIGVYFKDSDTLRMRIQQKVMRTADPASFSAAVNVDMYTKRKVIVQVPGPTLDAIKILPPVCTTEADVDWFATALDETLTSFYKTSPVVSMGVSGAKSTLRSVRDKVAPRSAQKKTQ